MEGGFYKLHLLVRKVGLLFVHCQTEKFSKHTSVIYVNSIFVHLESYHALFSELTKNYFPPNKKANSVHCSAQVSFIGFTSFFFI